MTISSSQSRTAVIDGELHGLGLDQLARARDVEQMRGAERGNAKALLALLLHHALRGELRQRLAHGTAADAVALLEDAELELAVGLQCA